MGTNPFPPVSRRAVLGSLIAGGTSGCFLKGKPPTAGERVRLRYWTPFSGGDGDAMRALVNQFNTEHADVELRRQRFAFDEYYDRLSTGVANGTAPDIAVVHSSELRRFSDALVPLDPFLDSGAREEYLPTLWATGTVDGDRLGLPLDTHPNLLYYNRDLFADAGLDPDAPPATFDQLRRSADAIVANTDSDAFNPDPYGRYYVRQFGAWLAARDASLLNDAHTAAAFDGADGRALAAFYDAITGQWNWDDPDTRANRGTRAFRVGDLAMTINGTWYAGVLESTDIDWQTGPPFVAPGGTDGRTWTDDHLLCLVERPDRVEAETRAGVGALRWLTTNTELWATQAGHVPASRAVIESSRLRRSPVWEQSLGTAVRLVRDGALVRLPRTADNDAYRRPINDAIEAIYAQRASPVDALVQAADRVTTNLSADSSSG